MDVEDYLELDFYKEERLQNFLPGLAGPVPKVTKGERWLFRKRHLRQQFSILMQIQSGMRYDSTHGLEWDGADALSGNPRISMYSVEMIDKKRKHFHNYLILLSQ